MTRNYLIHLLKQYRIIDADNTLNVKFHKRLMDEPVLMQALIDATSFLRGSANAKVRLHVLLQGLQMQPVCKTCKKDVSMRVSGPYRFSFPTYCSSKCSSNDPDVIARRVQSLKGLDHSHPEQDRTQYPDHPDQQ